MVKIRIIPQAQVVSAAGRNFSRHLLFRPLSAPLVQESATCTSIPRKKGENQGEADAFQQRCRLFPLRGYIGIKQTYELIKEIKNMQPNMKEMMRQAQMLQKKMNSLQEELAGREVEASVGGGMVRAVANGKPSIISISIEKEVVDPEDVEMLQDLIVAAVNEALTRSKEMVDGEMAKVTGGFKVPGMF